MVCISYASNSRLRSSLSWGSSYAGGAWESGCRASIHRQNTSKSASFERWRRYIPPESTDDDTGLQQESPIQSELLPLDRAFLLVWGGGGLLPRLQIFNRAAYKQLRVGCQRCLYPLPDLPRT